MKKPLISVIVPIFNSERFLEKCILSILNQTYKKFELLLIDDGSSDSSAEICEKFKKIDKRVFFYKIENCGAGAARNFGLLKVKGELISFIDSDDFVAKEFLEILYNNLITFDSDISCVKKDTSVTPDDNTVEIYYQPEIMKQYLVCNFGITQSPCDKLYKASLFSDLKFSTDRLFEDADLMYRLISKANKIVVQNSTLYYYLQHPNSSMHKPFTLKRFTLIDVYFDMFLFYEKHFPQYSSLALEKLIGSIKYIYGETLKSKINANDLFLKYDALITSILKYKEKITRKNRFILSILLKRKSFYKFLYILFK